MQRFWQKDALLVRNAIPGFTGMLQRDDVFELATRDDVESRLVRVGHALWTYGLLPEIGIPISRMRGGTGGGSLETSACSSVCSVFSVTIKRQPLYNLSLRQGTHRQAPSGTTLRSCSIVRFMRELG